MTYLEAANLWRHWLEIGSLEDGKAVVLVVVRQEAIRVAFGLGSRAEKRLVEEGQFLEVVCTQNHMAQFRGRYHSRSFCLVRHADVT